jgi:two-component system, cell cycle sensor histidine kinase and response regulator CckA
VPSGRIGGAPWRTEGFELRGRTVEVHAFATNPGSLALIFVDLTERRKSEEARRASEERYRIITDTSTDTISMHAPDGTVTFVSPACQALLDRTPEELVGSDLCELVHPEDRAVLRAAHEQVVLGRIANPTVRLRRKDGSWVWVEATARVGRDSRTGAFREIVNVVRDITARRELEEQLLQAQKLDSLGRLAGGIAHDFNNLLTVINGYAAILAAELSEDDPRRESLGEIAVAGTRAATLTHQPLAFGRKQVLCSQVIDLNETIAETERILRRTIGEDIELQLIAGMKPAMVKADPGQIQQVVLNLAVNARDAMPLGGRLVFETSRAAEPESGSPPEIALCVSDTGTGMTEAVRRRIFEPFFTTKPAGRGTGLGLATAFGIVTQSGGRIEVDSTVGQGTTFRIFLPESAEPVQVASPDRRPGRGGGGETILLVEDQDDVRRMAARMLQSIGYQVLSAAGAAEALGLWSGHREAVRLVLTDVVMPEMNGRELGARLQQLSPGLPVAFMSGYAETAMPGGVPDDGLPNLRKPFSADELADWVGRALAPAGSVRILVVDDDAVIRKLIRRVLEAEGFSVAEAGDGTEALEAVAKGAFGLVITDVVMPGKAGLETIRDLRSRYPDVPVVAISGVFEGQFLSVAEAAGACAALKKPIAPELLLETVRGILGRQ